jgi:hypothetical protein
MYRVLPATPTSKVDGGNCCLDLPNVGTPSPNWASQVPSTWNGLIWDEYNQVLSSEWWFDKLSVENYHTERRTTTSDMDEYNTTTTTAFPFHTARQVVSLFGRGGSEDDDDDYEGRPVLFTFPGMANGRQDMHYLYHTMKKYIIPDSKRTSLFQLPDGCQHKLCSERKAKKEQQQK